ncbi:hypothetical protein LANSK_17310 [Lactobacillus amylovorus subsp. amylovorus]
MNNDIEKVLFDQDQLNKRMDEMAARLNKKYEGQEPIVIPVLNGAMIFASDMIKRLTFELTIDPMRPPVMKVPALLVRLRLPKT